MSLITRLAPNARHPRSVSSLLSPGLPVLQNRPSSLSAIHRGIHRSNKTRNSDRGRSNRSAFGNPADIEQEILKVAGVPRHNTLPSTSDRPKRGTRNAPPGRGRFDAAKDKMRGKISDTRSAISSSRDASRDASRGRPSSNGRSSRSSRGGEDEFAAAFTDRGRGEAREKPPPPPRQFGGRGAQDRGYNRMSLSRGPPRDSARREVGYESREKHSYGDRDQGDRPPGRDSGRSPGWTERRGKTPHRKMDLVERTPQRSRYHQQRAAERRERWEESREPPPYNRSDQAERTTRRDIDRPRPRGMSDRDLEVQAKAKAWYQSQKDEGKEEEEEDDDEPPGGKQYGPREVSLEEVEPDSWSRRGVPLSIPHTTAASQFLYGQSVVEAALKARRRQLYKVYIYQGRNRTKADDDDRIRRRADKAGVEVQTMYERDQNLMSKMSVGRPHNGYIVEASPLPQMPIETLGAEEVRNGQPGFTVKVAAQSKEEAAVNGTNGFVPYHSPAGRHPFVVLLDGIVDPGNLGAIVRTAAFMGVDAVVTTDRGSARFTATALKASAGAAETVKLFSAKSGSHFVRDSKAAGWTIYVGVPEAGRALTHLSMFEVEKNHNPLIKGPTLLVIGSEGEGISKWIRSRASYEVSIPSYARARDLDSLNASVASGLLIQAIVRPREGENRTEGVGAKLF